MLQKSYDKSNALYIVPTPIGNLDDITARGIETLKTVDYIFAEDTRTSSILLNKFDIKKSLVPCHKFNEETIKKKALELLKEGKNIALISDQGTPLISDPGYLTVKEIANNGYNVIALPGATAFVPALNMSAITSEKFMFYGFLNSKPSIARKELEELKTVKYTIILYEAPHRLDNTLQLILEILGNREISISREITKVHEEVFRGTVSEAINEMKNKKGEFVIIISGNNFEARSSVEDALNDVKYLIKCGMSEKDAIKFIASKDNLSKNELYSEYHRGDI